MKTRKRKCVMALVLCLCMMVTMLPLSGMAFAAEPCPNHAVHDDTCGFVQAVDRHECGHTHDDTCGYTEAQPCGYTCELCGKTDNEPEPKRGEETETEQAVCALTEGCTLPTGHEGECVTEPGEGEKETACTLTEGCTLPDGHEGECVTELPSVDGALVKTITSWTFVGDDNLNEGELPLPGVSMERQADFDTLVSMLPTGISAEIEGEAEPAQVDITGWSCPEYVQDENGNWPVTGEYVFTAKLRSGYACDPLPTVKALMGGAELYSQTITGNGYSFDPDSGKLTVSSNVGTTEWRKNSYLPNKEIVTKLEITNAVTAIGKHAFLESGIESVTIPNSVTAIGERAFEGCTSLTSINIPNSVTAIGERAFADCTSLTSIRIPDSVTAIVERVFIGCTSLTSIHIPSSVTAIGENAFEGCTKLTSVTLAQGLKAGIGAYAFRDCTSLTSINIPNSVTAIGEGAFIGCTSLTSVTLAQGLKVGIGPSAFRGCTSLTSINIPNSVTAIGAYAFLDCTNLANVTFERNSAPSIGIYPFGDTSADLVIHVPVGAAGYNGTNWPTDKIVEGSALPLTNLTISGGTITPMFRMGTQTYTATVPATVTSVTVTPSAKGTITVNGQTVASGASSEAIMLEAGKDNEIKIVVKSDDTLSRAYTVTVTREPLIVTDIKEIPGVSVPVLGNTPVTTITETAQYTGTVSWNPNHSTFAADTNYTATITLTPKAGYTLQGVAENFFTVNGAAPVTNAENSGVITAVFPKTDKAPIDLKAIEGIAAPVQGNTPVTTITETMKYTGTVSWNPNHSTFAADTEYTATITLTPKAGYTLQGVAENFFTVTGVTSVTNAENSGVITAVFPKTGTAPTITGVKAMTVAYGYAATSSQTFTLTGNPSPIVTLDKEYDGKITWNDNTKKLNIAAGLGVGTYPITLTASNGIDPKATLAFTLTVEGEAPMISGQTAMTLTHGYKTASTSTFTVTGNPVPTVTKTSGDAAITWNDREKRLEIAEGLRVGIYPVTLTASNGVLPDATITYTLTVDGEASALTGPTSMTLIQGYPAASTGVFTITGNPVPSITIDNTYDGKITWNDADKKLEIAEGLAAGVYQVTLTADNGVLSDATITFTLTVLAPPTHEIIGGGDTEVKPGEDYGVTFKGDFKSWKAIRLNGVEMGIVPRSDTLSYLTYPGYTGNAGKGEAGSVKITLYKDFLETLPAGIYKLEVEFEDGGVQTAGKAAFKLLKELKPKPTPDTKPGTTKPANPSDVPPTGDTRQLWPWVLLMLAALISGSTVLIYKKKGRRQK